MSDLQITFSAEERDILQEVMNIAFGKASADLAEVIDIYVVLSIPDIMLLGTSEVPQFIEKEVKNLEKISVIKQSFTGRFHGTALLLFPAGAGQKLFTLFENGSEIESGNEPFSMVLEKETLLEVGNILVGASVSKVAELLNDEVSFRPPRIMVENRPAEIVDWDLAEPEGPAILLRTIFSFDKRDIDGLLFLIPSFMSFEWLKEALRAFLQQYE